MLIEDDAPESRQRALEMAEANVAMHREGSPNQANALTTLAWVYYKLGRREDAEKILSQITQNNQLTTDGAYYVAKLLADRGEKDAPVRSSKRCSRTSRCLPPGPMPSTCSRR